VIWGSDEWVARDEDRLIGILNFWSVLEAQNPQNHRVADGHPLFKKAKKRLLDTVG